MRCIFLAGIVVFLFSCNSSGKKENKEEAITISPVAMTAEKLPSSIAIKGKLDGAWQWTDNTGENFLILSYVEPYDDKGKNEFGEEGQTAELHAMHYLKTGDQYSLIWTNDESVKSCPFDITCEFIKNAATITDLDKDGTAETTIQYRLACRSDVSPALMKLVMHEGSASYSLKGLSYLKASPEDSFTVTEKDANLETLPGYNRTDDEFMKTFGRYESEKEFAKAPPEFPDHARKQWMKFVKERFE